MKDRELLASIYALLLSKKAQDPVIIRFENHPLCDFFLICHGDSSVQVRSMADALLGEFAYEKKLKPSHVEGYQNAEWILLDYGNLIVHIFQKHAREYYQIEKLWGDYVDTGQLFNQQKTFS
ncbi:MAG: ribosome silencing factor [Bacteroidales bacterium]|nr:ribosome silencing factor [Bacteroidales bacterium]